MERDPYITTYRGGAGWMAVHVFFDQDMGDWDVWQTGIGRYASKDDAATEARDWADAEGLKYVN